MRSRGVVFILGFIIGLIVLPVCGYFYFRFGYAPVAATAAPMPFEKTMAKMALKSRIRAEAPKSAPIPPDEPNLTAGAKIYAENCAFCHGLPNQAAPSPAAQGMFPPPPQLFTTDEMVTDDPVGSTYWKVANGIRLTGMPAFSKSLSTTQCWQVTLFLSKADKLPDPAKAALDASGTVPAKK
ncbi:MAG TPA: cytochrome c [Candidatus Angelobacter sp.]